MSVVKRKPKAEKTKVMISLENDLLELVDRVVVPGKTRSEVVNRLVRFALTPQADIGA